MFCRPRIRGGDFAGGGVGFLSPDVPRESHEKGLLKPFAIDGSGEGRSCVGGGDIACDGETDLVVEEAREESWGG